MLDIHAALHPVGLDINDLRDVIDGHRLAGFGIGGEPLEALGIGGGGHKGGKAALLHILVAGALDDGGHPDHRVIDAGEGEIMPVGAEDIVGGAVIEVDGHVAREHIPVMRGEGDGHLHGAAAEAGGQQIPAVEVKPVVFDDIDAVGARRRGDLGHIHQSHRVIARGGEDLADLALRGGFRHAEAEQREACAQAQQHGQKPDASAVHSHSPFFDLFRQYPIITFQAPLVKKNRSLRLPRRVR